MKKIFTLAALAVSALAVNAQVTWNLESDLSGVAAKADKFTVSEAVFGAGLKNDGFGVYKFKNPEGASVDYPWPAIKVTPTNDQVSKVVDGETKQVTDDQYRNISQATDDAQAMYLNFKAETSAMEDLMTISSVEFDATRVGTDGVRVNVRILGNDGAYTSGWLVNGSNASSVATNGAWDQKDADGDAWQTTGDAGFRPARNDYKNNAENTNGYTHFTVPAPADLPEDLYQATVQIAVYGISSNKNAYLHGVTLNCSIQGESAVQGVAESKSEAKKAVKVITANGVQIGNFNVAGQQVK